MAAFDSSRAKGKPGQSQKIRVGLVGLGFGAEFIPIYRDHPNVQSVAICDENHEKLQRACSRFGISQNFSRFEDLLASDQIDAIHLVTPIPLHARQTIAVLEAGKHCACTVPMATSFQEITAIIQAQRRSGKNYMMMETAVYTREFLFVQDLYRKGEFGEITFARGAHYQDMEGWPSYWLGLPPHYYMTHAVAPVLCLLKKRVRKTHCLGSGRLPEERQKQYANPFPVETAIFKLQDSEVAVEVTRTLFQTVRPYTESFSIYGEKLGFEWQQIEEEDPLIFSTPQPGSGRGRKILHQSVEVPDRQDLLPPEIAPFTKKSVFSDGRHLSFVQGGGHSGSHPHLVHEFVSSIIDNRTPAIDALTAANWTAPGIAAHQSALADGAEVQVPNFEPLPLDYPSRESADKSRELRISSDLSRRHFVKLATAGAILGVTGIRSRADTSRSEINLIGWNSQALMQIAARAEHEIGIKINYDVLPAKWDDVMQKITLWGQTGYSEIDVLFADDLIGGLWGMNGWAEDLSDTDAWTKHSTDVVDNINVLNLAVGGVYRIFFFMGLESFFYNKTLIPTPPTTWQELVEKGKAATNSSNGVWGWRPLGGEGHAFNTVLLALNQAGADLSTLKDPATLTALQFVYDWAKTNKITPPSTVSEDNTAVEALAAAGKAAMWWTYESGFNGSLAIDRTVLTRQTLGVARWPKGPAGDTALVHGWGFLVPKSSKRKQAAKQVINWFAQPELIREINIAQSVPPPYKSLLVDPQINNKLPVLSAGPGWAELIRGAKFREPIVNHKQVTQLWKMFDKLGTFVLSGEKTPPEAQKWVIDEYESIG